MKRPWTNYITLGYRVLLLASTAAVLYLQNHFVTKEVYDADRKAIAISQQAMQDILTAMIERNKVNDRQDETLKDHETRLRKLEQKRL